MGVECMWMEHEAAVRNSEDMVDMKLVRTAMSTNHATNVEEHEG